ncbi:hypothetical protein HDU76_008089 [Blyttiomyces sp. JEL0837]|nr:hypothetical protein HDU76_008089 [Blyttiomyces sp. JEL0837]
MKSTTTKSPAAIAEVTETRNSTRPRKPNKRYGADSETEDPGSSSTVFRRPYPKRPRTTKSYKKSYNNRKISNATRNVSHGHSSRVAALLQDHGVDVDEYYHNVDDSDYLEADEDLDSKFVQLQVCEPKTSNVDATDFDAPTAVDVVEAIDETPVSAFRDEVDKFLVNQAMKSIQDDRFLKYCEHDDTRGRTSTAGAAIKDQEPCKVLNALFRNLLSDSSSDSDSEWENPAETLQALFQSRFCSRCCSYDNLMIPSDSTMSENGTSFSQDADNPSSTNHLTSIPSDVHASTETLINQLSEHLQSLEKDDLTEQSWRIEGNQFEIPRQGAVVADLNTFGDVALMPDLTMKRKKKSHRP